MDLLNRRKIVYLPLMGRIGNQLFEYAFAYTVQQELGKETLLIIDSSEVENAGWLNSLTDYNLPNVVYVKDGANDYSRTIKQKKRIFKIFYEKILFSINPQILYSREKKWQFFFNFLGIIAVAKGYADHRINISTDYYLYGYFQSERYFSKYRNDIRNLFDLNEKLNESNYPGIEQIRNRNSVCISVKIEHNLGSSIYDVCDETYYKEAISYIRDNVKDPLFFVCSDNVEKAKEVFFKDLNSEIVLQSDKHPVSLSLCAMSNCKHFIINNTSYGWWAQYLCENKEKIVVAPKKWMKNTDPVSIYDGQDGWYLL